jgi:hypothetical protein
MTAEVELIGRFKKKKSKTREDLAWEESQRIINPDFDKEQDELEPYTYDPMVVDLYNIVDYMKLDPEHVQVTMRYGVYYIFKCPYETFKALREQMTRIPVMDATDVRIEETRSDTVRYPI